MRFFVLLAAIAGGIYFYLNHFGDAAGKVVPVDDQNFQEVVLQNEKPVVLVFYWARKTSAYDHLWRGMGKLGELAGEKGVFAKYCMQDGKMDEKFGVKNDAVCVRFENGSEVKREGLADLKQTPSLSVGQVFLMVRDFVGKKLASFSGHHDTPDLTAADLDGKVKRADKPVLVNVTESSSSCGIVHASANAFKSVANEYGAHADFYFMDVRNSQNHAFLQKNKIHKIPSVVSFYKGKRTFKSEKTYEGVYNEAQFLGMFLPYLKGE